MNGRENLIHVIDGHRGAHTPDVAANQAFSGMTMWQSGSPQVAVV
jgi:hypothetical protein